MSGTAYKPEVDLPIGANVFEIIGVASKVLDAIGQRAKSNEMRGRVFSARSYGDAIAIVREYVEDTSGLSVDDDDDEGDDDGD